jgi:hypothetical protein
MKGVLEMQGKPTTARVLTTCASCGGDPGGLIFEGLVLVGVLTPDDIVVILRNTIDRRTVLRLLRSDELQGRKLGKSWVIEASQFIADWGRLRRQRHIATRPSRARRPVVVEVLR